MRRALMEAQAAFDEDEIPVGAIIVCKDRIISRAHNLTEMLTDVTAHAEMQAITSGANMLGGKYLKDCTLYVTVEPCATMCPRRVGKPTTRTTATTSSRLQVVSAPRLWVLAAKNIGVLAAARASATAIRLSPHGASTSRVMRIASTTATMPAAWSVQTT